VNWIATQSHHVGGLVERGVDAVAVSTAHGHTKGVGDTVKLLRSEFPDLAIIAGNVTTARASNISPTRREHDQDRPGARLDLHDPHRRRRGHPADDRAPRLLAHGLPRRASAIIADGGITKSGDIVKALTLATP
jgi:IMP dehydrogenase